MKSHKGFDKLSSIYDLLVKIVFGSAIRKAQIILIEKIQDRKDWLVLGGGTGWILEEILKAHPHATVTYVEVSKKMINKTKKRGVKGNINYVLGTIDQLPREKNYDIVITMFFWDMFSTNEALKMKEMINRHLNNHAIWLLADFKNTDIWWQRILMEIMYWFFRVTCHINAYELPDFDLIFKKEKYTMLFQQTFYHGMIESTIYK